ncbi:MAG: hypothetical protein RJA36_2844 [Pseudomonadota bacterium]|jgi:hypothetical protein
MAYLVRIERERAGTTTRGWQARAYIKAPRYVSQFFSAAEHGGMRGAQAAARAKLPEIERLAKRIAERGMR